ncbi:germination protein YpeB [Paenibacillus sp. chi10]|uniref:Germination protein YpeB n=1 Tax=Paenibacillus suaedae TaxID=3077233 RepID=A0AAJ2JS72_9BACL|nr:MULTISPECIES: germination protein YpeB [unclassified Paenibacillus]MDT8976068.1 germination protein YpeB [Paenibacillus sp. chi10]GAV11112.1 sporulation protein YpeB [Paenibacillus sp. NAIST15-1]
MYKRLSAVMFPIFALLFIGAIVWGYQEHQEKNSILIKAENQYQRAFHDLTYHVDKLHSELGQTLAVNSKSQAMHRKGLVNVWRITSQAQNEINQLPLTLLPFNKTEDFLSRISNFSYRAAVRDMTKQPLSDDEVKILKTLHQNAAQISQDLQKVQNKVISQSLRWMDVETAMASEKKTMDNTIIDGFKTVDKKVSEYPELNWGPSISSVYTKRSVKMLKGNPLSEQQIKEKAEKFLIKKPNEPVQVRKNGKGTEYESYTVFTKYKNDGSALTLDYTKQGFLMSYMDTRPVGKKKLTMAQAEESAKRFLKKNDYPDMAAVRYDEYNNTGSLTLVPVADGVYLYPQQVTARVALDNGEVTGLQAADFVYEGKERKVGKPKLGKKEAQAMLNPDMDVLYDRMSLIKNDLSEEVLCYEFGGKINGGAYRVYINADNGTEEQIEEMKLLKS